jgi:hypothetical protein
LLLWIGVGIAITLAVGQDGLLINNTRDGSSALLDFWSPRCGTVVAGADVVAPAWTYCERGLHAMVAGRRHWRRRAAARMRTVRPGASALIAQPSARPC